MSDLQPITKDDIYALLERLRIELFRRSGWDKDGNPIHEEMYRYYNQPIFASTADIFTGDKFKERTIRESIELSGNEATDDDTNKYGDEFLDMTIEEAIKLTKSDVINAFQGHSLIGAILNICDFEDLRHVKEFDMLPGAFSKEKIEKFLSILEADTFSTKTPHCRSACTGLCMNACTDTCSGSCVGVCAACSANCVGGCHTGCDGCSSNCGTSCGVGCGTGCAAQATGCGSCYSACSGCVSCTDTCTSGCSGCSNQCTSCLAGCQGSSGYNNTCGCGSTCTTACGGKAASVAAGVTLRSVSFYHDKRVYGVRSAVPDTGTILIPSIVDYDNIFTPTSYQKYWMDEDGNKFTPGQTVRVASSTTVYNNLKSSGIAVTKSTKMRSYIPRIPAYLCPPMCVISPDPADTLISETHSAGDSLILPYASTITITSDEFTGLSTEKTGVMIDSKYVALPYSYHHPKGTKITFIGGTFKITYHAIPNASWEITLGTELVSCFVPYALVCKVGTSNFLPCEYSNNSCVGVHVDNARIKGNHVSTPGMVKLTAESLCDIHSNGTYNGYQFAVCLEEFRYDSEQTPVCIDGEKDALHNAFIMGTDHSIKYLVPLLQERNGVNSDMTSVWECTIPSRETLGFDSSVECLIIPECGDDRPMVKIPFGSKLCIHTRQDFFLYPFTGIPYSGKRWI